LEVGFLNTKTVSEAYSGKPLPSYVAMLVGSSVTCSETGKSFVLEDINKLYLTPVLEPWCCLKRVWNRAIMVTAQFFSPFRSGTGIALRRNCSVDAKMTRLRHVDWFEVTEMRGLVEKDQVKEFQVTVKIGFQLEEQHA
jgi:flavin-binding protein dodecin